MKISQAFIMAFRAIASNKMRSFLTMLGIIIGVMAVTMLISIGSSSTSSITDSISGLGTNLLTVNLRSPKPVNLTLEDLQELEGQGGIGKISPATSSSQTVKNGTQTHDTTVEGVTQSYCDIRGFTLAQGRMVAQSDLDLRTAVAIIGVEVADALYQSRDVVGESITISGRSFTIVGVLEEKGSSMMGSNDDRVIIPFTTAQRLFKSTKINSFYVSSESEATVSQAEETLKAFLLRKTGDTDYFSIFNQTSLLDTLSTVTATLTVMLGGISGISLLVGGIGIMNIMLVSVTERTREIGIRKAIGAQRFDILIQFMIEAMSISIVGGIIGLLVGWGGLWIVEQFMGSAMTMSPGVAVFALIFSLAIGVIFGSYPASKASKLRPIDALRYE